MSSKLKPSEINVQPFEKALKSLSQILKETENAITRDATIQRFEYTFELSWKLLKRYFKLNNNLDLFNVKDIFREAGKQGFIDKVENWFEYLEARNLTSHTYDETIADKVYARAKEFEQEASLLLQKIKKILK